MSDYRELKDGESTSGKSTSGKSLSKGLILYRYTYYGYDSQDRQVEFAEINTNSIPANTDISKRLIKYSYDIEDRLVELEYGSDLGNIKSLSFGYDKFKRINTITANTTSGSGKLREYTHDQRGRVDTIRDYTDFKDGGLSLSHKWKECKFSYDNLDRQTEINYIDSENDDKVMESYKLSYDKNNHITKEEIHNDYPSEKSSIVTKNMDIIDEEDSNVQEGEEGTTVEQENETTPAEDEAGSVSGKQDEIRSYTYDGLGQLTKVEIEDPVSGSTTEKNYTYDILGNRTKEVEEGETREYDYNSLNQLISSVTSTGEEQDESGEEGTEGSTINGITSDMLYTYDKAGNQTKVSDSISGDTTEMSYDPAARLSQAVIKNGDKTKLIQTNLYNGNGQRVEKAEQIGTDVETNNYFYQGDSLLYTKSNHEFVDANKATKNVNSSAFNLLGLGENIIATERDGSNNSKDYYFYNKDARGSTTNLLDSNMESFASYKYDDFGNTETYAGENGYVDNEICYTGGVYDYTTQIYYLNARYYNPEDGNFISQDSYRGEKEYQGTWQLYAYCANNPINYIDPSGHDAIVLKSNFASRYVGHMAVIVQGKYFTWDPAEWSNGYIKKDVKKFIKNGKIINGKKFNKAVGRTSKSKVYRQYIYIKGDFSKSRDYIMNGKSKASIRNYSLTTTNCAWMAVHVLKKKYKKGSVMYNTLWNMQYSRIRNRYGRKVTIKDTIIPNKCLERLSGVYGKKIKTIKNPI